MGDMLATLKDVLAPAQAGRYAVAAFNCMEDVMPRIILETCATLRSIAVLIGLVGLDLEGDGWDYVAGLVKAVAPRHGVTKLNVYADNRLARCRGLIESARTQSRPDPLPRDVFGPMRRSPAESVASKIQLLLAENRV